MTLDKQLWRGKARFTHTAQQRRRTTTSTTTPRCSATMPISASTPFITWTWSSRAARRHCPMNQGGVGLDPDHAGAHPARAAGPGTQGAQPVDDRVPQQAEHAEIYRLHPGGRLPGGHPVHPGPGSGRGAHPVCAPPFTGRDRAHPERARRWRSSGCRWIWKTCCCAAATRGCNAWRACAAARCRWTGSYNPMPPVPGQIYPQLPLEAVREV